MRFPLNLEAYLTDDDTNVLQRISKRETHIPYGKHCGAFGVKRREDIHCGIDLYAPDGEDGVWLYGEIEPSPLIKPGIAVLEGERLGSVKQVLRNDKGRPMSMLHMERYAPGTREYVQQWHLGDDSRPEGLLDPTELLSQFDSFLEWCRWEDGQGFE